jgi:hypothetical protein
MKCALMQPAFLPWQGLFELILESDRFVFLDDFQFSLQSYQQRNRLFVARGQVDWYTVPVAKDSYRSPLNEARISAHDRWPEKMLKRIQANYGRSPCFRELYPWLESWLPAEHSSLAELNIAFIRHACELMGIGGELRLSSELPSGLQRSERVLELIHWCEADSYLSARGSFGYMLEDGLFPAPGIEVVFQDFVCRPYPQLGSPGEFVPYLSLLDALMNVGPEATRELVRSGSRHWTEWDEMVALAEKAA